MEDLKNKRYHYSLADALARPSGPRNSAYSLFYRRYIAQYTGDIYRRPVNGGITEENTASLLWQVMLKATYDRTEVAM